MIRFIHLSAKCQSNVLFQFGHRAHCSADICATDQKTALTDFWKYSPNPAIKSHLLTWWFRHTGGLLLSILRLLCVYSRCAYCSLESAALCLIHSFYHFFLVYAWSHTVGWLETNVRTNKQNRKNRNIITVRSMWLKYQLHWPPPPARAHQNVYKQACHSGNPRNVGASCVQLGNGIKSPESNSHA